MNSRTISTAVMARRVEPADSLDYFPTPPWATRAFCRHVLPLVERAPLSELTALDPACGEGHMALALAAFFELVETADIFAYGADRVQDFLHPDAAYEPVDWIITNPPFNLAIGFVLKALQLARRGVAMLVRSSFLEGEDRYSRLFLPHPPTLFAQYVERAPMHRGRWVVNGTSATSYCWLVWAHERQPLPPFWIPKSRRALALPDDWLRFSGCCDIPAKHRALMLQDNPQGLTLADIRQRAQQSAAAVVGKREMELLL